MVRDYKAGICRLTREEIGLLEGTWKISATKVRWEVLFMDHTFPKLAV